MKHIAIIYGTRPQVIKLAPLVKELDKHKDKLTYSLINTGQHYDDNMDGVFHRQLGISPPEYNIREGGLKNEDMPLDITQTIRIGYWMVRLSLALTELKPDLVIVIGDTDSTLAGALSAKKMGIPLAHIEAGVRSGDKSQPEEINRILVDEMSDMHFIPDGRIVPESMFTHGCSSCDLMLDAFLMYKDKAVKPETYYDIEGKFNLLTLHRANLTEDFIKDVFRAIEFIGVQTIWPVHPRIGKLMEHISEPKNLFVMEPASYFEMLWLVQNANHILTDSGGLVREAGFAGKPCTILRTESEWPGQVLRDYTALAVLNSINMTLNGPTRMSLTSVGWQETHGNGKASEKIVKALFDYLKIEK